MLAALFLSGALISLTHAVNPPDYSERSLCHVWAGAQCHQTQCRDDGKERCMAESRQCREASEAVVSKERAAKVVECARLILKQKCGEPVPAECANIRAF